MDGRGLGDFATPRGIMITIRDRDELWCRCLCAALDPHDIADVLEIFNRERPDKPRRRTPEEQAKGPGRLIDGIHLDNIG